MKITKRQLRRIIREATLTEFWGKKKPRRATAREISFDWDPSGLSMVMSVDGEEVTSFTTQKNVKDLITQLEGLLVGPMRTTG